MNRVYDVLARETRKQARLYDLMQQAEIKRQAAIRKALKRDSSLNKATHHE